MRCFNNTWPLRERLGEAAAGQRAAGAVGGAGLACVWRACGVAVALVWRYCSEMRGDVVRCGGWSGAARSVGFDTRLGETFQDCVLDFIVCD